jgi:hypothetical protein
MTKPAVPAATICLLALVAFSGLKAAGPEAARPAALPSSAATRRAEGDPPPRSGNLVLSTDAESVAEHFSFRLRLRSAHFSADFLEVRDGARGGCVMRVVGANQEILPWWFATDGLYVSFDPELKGGLVACERGNYDGFLGVNKDGFDVHIAATTKARRIRADPAAVLGFFFTRFAWFGPRTAMTVKWADTRQSRYPIEKFECKADQMSLTFDQVFLNAMAGRPWIGRTLADVRQLGLPVRVVTIDDLVRMPLLPPKTFGADKAERAAIEKVNSFLETPPASAPAPSAPRTEKQLPKT